MTMNRALPLLVVATAIAAATAVAQPTCDPATAAAGWAFAGPSTYVDRDDPLKIASAGAIQDVAFSGGGNASVWFAGSVNGGVWRTSTIADKVPKWTNVLDGQVRGATHTLHFMRDWWWDVDPDLHTLELFTNTTPHHSRTNVPTPPAHLHVHRTHTHTPRPPSSLPPYTAGHVLFHCGHPCVGRRPSPRLRRVRRIDEQ